MLRPIIVSALFMAAPLYGALAQDDLLRLPGQGELKDDTKVHVEGLGRLIPGGGLLFSFDTDKDGQITKAELEAGIEAAFLAADANANGRLTPLEQKRWSEGLPTRDVSLANPARFDPNLDRVVRDQEFASIVRLLAEPHVDPVSGAIPIIALKSKQQNRVAPGQIIDEERDRRSTAEREETATQTSRRPRTGGGGS